MIAEISYKNSASEELMTRKEKIHSVLQTRLHEEERNSQREQRLDDIVANTLRHLAMDDVRTANAWLRDRIAVTVEGRHVVKIALLF